MATFDQRLQESQIFLDSISGLKAILSVIAVDYGQAPLAIAMVPSTFAKREIAEQNGGNFNYPFMAVTLQRVAKAENSYNSNLRRDGVSIRKNSKILTYKLMPVVANFRVMYFTQDNADLLKFSTRWLQREKDAQFKLENDELDINIKVRINPDLSIPEQEMTDFGSEFILQTECEMQSYVGEIESKVAISQVNITSNLWDRTKQSPINSSTRVISRKISPNS